tara:strand:- start:6854 stop:7330 length:477 start_codon:yes stop_codon:yes gene_type:complete
MSQKYKVYVNNTLKIIEENWQDFCSKYILIEAAGGLVFNREDQILMIFRNGKWDLPKGKLEEGENKKQCAIREVEEECGICGLNIIEKHIETYHTYNMDGEEVLKKTYWYKMNTDFNGELMPQIEEGITKVSWVEKDHIAEKIRNSYGNISDVLNRIF